MEDRRKLKFGEVSLQSGQFLQRKNRIKNFDPKTLLKVVVDSTKITSHEITNIFDKFLEAQSMLQQQVIRI